MSVDVSAAYQLVGGDNITLTCTTNITSPDSYEWYKDETNIYNSSTDATYNIGNEETADGEYKCLAIKGDDRSSKSAGTTIAFNSKYWSVFH